MEEEAKIDTGHSYDGIRELDNVTPPWFTTAFLLTIVFGLVYLYRYHVAHSAPLQVEEFKTEMAVAEADKVKFLATQSNNVDESNVKELGAADIAEGKKIFTEKCVACHQAHGGSMPGGVGPNLTDDYWLHGGSIVDVFKTIKYGWPEKGMISWKDQMTPNQMAQTASFVLSLKGTNPPNAKEPQGELYTAVAAAAKDTTTTKDTITVK
jgi:cytochrome c oxidase cbb3-type subunit 3